MFVPFHSPSSPDFVKIREGNKIGERKSKKEKENKIKEFSQSISEYLKVSQNILEYPRVSQSILEYPRIILESPMRPFFLPHVVLDWKNLFSLVHYCIYVTSGVIEWQISRVRVTVNIKWPSRVGSIMVK